MSVTGAKLARAAKAELARRGRANRLQPPGVKIRDVCHPKQASLVESLVLGKARNVVAGAGRQSGKSHGAALAALLVAAGVPGVNLIYVASTHATCKKMAFLPAVTLNRELSLGGTPAYGQELAIAFPNGSAVYFLGADSEKTIERLRGVPNLVMCIIDEASVYAPDALKQMIETVRPGLRPRRGKLVIMGTGSRQGQQGTWYELKQNAEYEQHRFDYRDNDRVPSHADVETTIDEDLKAQFPELTPAEARKTAWFRREYLGDDVVELAEMVYQITEDNLVDELPDFDVGAWTFATGGDLGVSANDALVSLAWRDEDPAVYVADQEAKTGQDSIACADMVNGHNQLRAPLFIALDPGGLGIKTIRTVQSLYPDAPVVEAEKPPVAIQVRAVNILAQGGRLKIKRGSPLALQLVGPTWVDGIVGGKIDEHGKHSDLAPGLRYVAVKVLPLLPDLAQAFAGPKPDNRAERIAVALKKAQKRRPGDFGDDPEPGGDDLEPGSPWD
jgi:hypothetical protein